MKFGMVKSFGIHWSCHIYILLSCKPFRLCYWFDLIFIGSCHCRIDLWICFNFVEVWIFQMDLSTLLPVQFICKLLFQVCQLVQFPNSCVKLSFVSIERWTFRLNLSARLKFCKFTQSAFRTIKFWSYWIELQIDLLNFRLNFVSRWTLLPRLPGAFYLSSLMNNRVQFYGTFFM
jgi:hypothetical protein